MDKLAEFLDHKVLRCDPIGEDGYGRTSDCTVPKSPIRMNEIWKTLSLHSQWEIAGIVRAQNQMQFIKTKEFL